MPTKRGRPVTGNAMTPAERTRKSRASKRAAKLSAPPTHAEQIATLTAALDLANAQIRQRIADMAALNERLGAVTENRDALAQEVAALRVQLTALKEKLLGAQ